MDYILRYYLLIVVWCLVGGVQIRIDVVELENSNNLTAGGRCCGDNCNRRCEYFFVGCLVSPTDKPGPHCSLKEWKSLTNSSLTIQFKLSFLIDFLPIKIIAYDVGDFGAKNLIDYFDFTIDTSNLTTTDATWHSGSRDDAISPARIKVENTVTCDTEAGCNDTCKPADSCYEGHYSCDNLTQSRICLEGWRGPFCNLTTRNFCPSVDADISKKGTQSDIIFVGSTSPDSSFQTIVHQFIARNLTLGRQALQFSVASLNAPHLFLPPDHRHTKRDVDKYFDASKSNSTPFNLTGALRRGGAFDRRYGARPRAFKAIVLSVDASVRQFGGDIVSDLYNIRRNYGANTYVIVEKSFAGEMEKCVEILTLTSTLTSTSTLTGVKTFTYRRYDEASINGAVASTLANIEMDGARNNRLYGVGNTRNGRVLTRVDGVGDGGGDLSAAGDEFCSFRGLCAPDATCCCFSGYVGHYCEYEENPCDINPCNNGKCISTIGKYFICECKNGFTGKHCENKLEDPAHCEICNFPTCIRDQDVYPDLDLHLNLNAHPGLEPHSNLNCSVDQPPCLPFHYGINCEKSCRPVSSCSQHMTCDADGNKVCEVGWSNIESGCSVQLSSYKDLSCQHGCFNGGFCYQSKCCCQNGFNGEYCQFSVPEKNNVIKIGSQINPKLSYDKMDKILTICGIILFLIILVVIAVCIVQKKRQNKRRGLVDITMSSSGETTVSNYNFDYVGRGLFRSLYPDRFSLVGYKTAKR